MDTGERNVVSSGTDDDMVRFLRRLDALPAGYSEGLYEGWRWGLTIRNSEDGRRRWLFGEELGGTDRISGNLYLPPGRPPILRPCEMPAGKVIAFVLAFRPAP